MKKVEGPVVDELNRDWACIPKEEVGLAKVLQLEVQ